MNTRKMTNTYDVNTVNTPVITQKRRIIHKKNTVTDAVDADSVTDAAPVAENTVFVSELDVDTLSVGMSVLTMDEPNPEIQDADEASVHTVVIDRKTRKKAPKKQQVTDDAEADTGSEAEDKQPVAKKARAPRKPKVQQDASDAEAEAEDKQPVAKKARAPRKPKAQQVSDDAGADTEDKQPVVKKARAPRKPKVQQVTDADAADAEAEDKQPVVKKSRAPRKPKVQQVSDDAGAETEDKQPVVKKARAPRKPKAQGTESHDASETEDKQPVEKQIRLHGPICPDTAEKFFDILRPFIKQSSRYSALAERPDGIIKPVFLKITGAFNEETKTYPCEFYKDTYTDDEETSNRVYKPVWTSVLEKGELNMNQCFNILPYDKDFNYVCLIPLQIPV